MRKQMAVILALLMAVPVVIAQETTGPYPVSAPTAKAYVILGKGIAASPADPMDFMIVKFGIGRFISPNGTEINLGVLIADEDKYRLKKITIGDGHATGKIYANGTEVGSFDVSSVMKGDTEVWAGTMDLNGNNYNLYVIEGTRRIKASELKDKVVEYCKNNPNDTNCRNKVYQYCQNNPTDRRCRALFRAYCLRGHMDDTRCRQEFVDYCKENPTNRYCIPFELKRAKVYCENHSDSILCRRIATKITTFCQNNPDNEGCAEVKQLITSRPKLLSKLQTLRTRIRNLKVNRVSAGKINATKITSAVNLPVSTELEGGE